MSKFLHILRFELRYYGRRLSTHVYFLLFFALAFLTMTAISGVFPSMTVSVGGTDGNVHANAPYVVGILATALSLFAIMVTAAIAGHAGSRDFAAGSYALFFTTPVKKWQYFGARYLAILPINFYIYAGIGLGLWAATGMPWVEPDRLGESRFLHYFMPYLVLIGPNIIFASAIFFPLAALTRKMLPNYLAGVLMVMGYMVAQTLSQDLTLRTARALADPFGISAAGEIARYWTTFEKNTFWFPADGLLLYNRLIWLGVAALIFVGGYLLFKFAQGGEQRRRRLEMEETQESRRRVLLPAPREIAAFRRAVTQYNAITRRAVSDVLGNVYFYAILGAGMLFLLLTAPQVGTMFGTPTWPVTYLMLDVLGGSFSLFVLIIITFYAGELVWHERDLRVDQLVDATPMPNWVPYCAKFTALALIVTLLLLVILVAGLITQAASGYFNFELGLYFRMLFGVIWIDLIILCALALAVQVLANHKYAGHFIVVLYFGFVMFRGGMGLEHNLHTYGSDPGMTYSDMNGFGPFLGPYLWYKLYWAMAALALAVISNLFWARGQEIGFRFRGRLARASLRGSPALLGACAVIVFGVLGGFIFYNNNILNEYRTTKGQEERAAQYERLYKQYEKLPQPRIISSSVVVDLFPERGDLEIRGELGLRNKTGQSIRDVHLQIPEFATIRGLEFGGGAEAQLIDDEIGYHIYKLATPLAPGEEIKLSFDFSFDARGFENNTARTAVVANGSFVHSPEITPRIGYNENGELILDRTRKKHGLEPKERMADLDDQEARANTYLANDADWIDFEAVVSTKSDQTALAPGYLQKEWTVDDRRYFHYKMDAPILNFYAFLSARYEVARDEWQGLPVEVYYHPGHEYNIEGMIGAVKKSLDYYSANFSPYQHRQVRILEFPRYALFAQSFPNTIPFSEGIGFIARVEDEDIDYPFYVTAHEVAHQWWAHQVIGANVQGSTVLSETMSQYSALMVMEKEYGADKMRQFLEHELDSYLMGRTTERKKEMPLIRVENQAYIHYRKGSLVMYALRDYLGEEVLNQALSNYLMQMRYQEPPYTNAREFVAAIREVTPPDLEYLIEDLFETITLYENRAVAATWRELDDGRYEVSLEVEAKKLRSDEQGREEEVVVEECIDVGVFVERTIDGRKEQVPLHMEKHRLESGENTLMIVVDEKPEQAGIDPYHKLIDRHPSDNLVDVEEVEAA